MYSFGITGSRNGMTQYQHDRLTPMLMACPFSNNSPKPSFHHGDCVGVDEQAHAIAVKIGYDIHIYPPENDKQRAYCSTGNIIVTHPPEPYLSRNKHIVLTVQHLIVVPDSNVERVRSGTWSTYQYALKTDTPYTIITPDGSDPILLEK